jgi:alkylated DNA repair protein alkB homolog 6
MQRFADLGIFDDTPHQRPNHVLINEYKPGEGIMPHEDGSAYAPVVATVSLGSTLCLELTPKSTSVSETPNGHAEGAHREDNPVPDCIVPTRVLQEPRSLLITMGEAYGELLHGIEPLEIDERRYMFINWSYG